MASLKFKREPKVSELARLQNFEQEMSNIEVLLLLRFEISGSSFALKESP